METTLYCPHRLSTSVAGGQPSRHSAGLRHGMGDGGLGRAWERIRITRPGYAAPRQQGCTQPYDADFGQHQPAAGRIGTATVGSGRRSRWGLVSHGACSGARAAPMLEHSRRATPRRCGCSDPGGSKPPPTPVWRADGAFSVGGDKEGRFPHAHCPTWPGARMMAECADDLQPNCRLSWLPGCSVRRARCRTSRRTGTWRRRRRPW